MTRAKKPARYEEEPVAWVERSDTRGNTRPGFQVTRKEKPAHAGRFRYWLLGDVILFGWSWSLSFHLLGGLRHLVHDVGLAMRVQSFVLWGWVSVIGSLVLTALIWLAAMLLRGQA